MRELRTGVWHWQAPHPDWEPSEPWDQEVSSYAIDDCDRLLLFDPLDPPGVLALPVEHVLPTHGAPTDLAALERALS